MKPIYRNSIIALLLIAAFFAGYKFGYIGGRYEGSIMANKILDDTYRRIREEDARKKRGEPSPDDTEKPPNSE